MSLNRALQTKSVALVLLACTTYASGSETPVNCDALSGAVDIEHCPEVRREALKATFCMYAQAPCDVSVLSAFRTSARLVRGDKKLCKRILNETFDTPDFSISHRLSSTDLPRLKLPQGPTSDVVQLGSGVARIDVNNDGRPELILSAHSMAPSWRGCSLDFFVEVNGSLDGFKRSRVSRFLVPAACGSDVSLFMHNNVTYFGTWRQQKLYTSYFNVLSEVHLVKGDAKRKVCQFAY